MENKMFCYQCQEALNNTGCIVNGVCGKTNQLANHMDIYKDSLKGLSKAILEYDKNNIEAQRYVMEGLFKLITNANFDEEVFKAETINAINIRETLKGNTLENSIEIDFDKMKENWKDVGTLVEKDNDLRGLKEFIITGLMGIAAYHSHSYRIGFEDKSIHEFMIKTLSDINDIKDMDRLIELVDNTGEYGVKVMALLDKANTSKYGNPEISKVNIGTKNRPGILISGHDLGDMEELLEQSKDSGVDVYTHSEMLPSHYYPKLKKYSHLVGNYGGSWWKQREEFEKFNGPILFTTNCIVPPSKSASYINNLYTTGNAGAPGFKRINEKNGKKDFSEIIEKAKNCNSPEEIEIGEIIGGFAHNQVLELADQVIENIKNGAIRKFIVMAGCDGRHSERNYYEEFAKNLKEDTIILTAGCAKYRYNKLGLGDINGIPRVLDAGQCNDSYSLVVIALKLKEVFELEDINELPISYNIAWYEQKAAIVLLALLHLGVKNIKLGPTLPAFATPAIIDVLVENFGISTIGSVEEDLEKIG